MEFKLVINNKEKAYSKGIKDDECNIFLNKKISDKVSGNTFGFKNYEFEISDRKSDILKLYTFLNQKGLKLIGFNNINFDIEFLDYYI